MYYDPKVLKKHLRASTEPALTAQLRLVLDNHNSSALALLIYMMLLVSIVGSVAVVVVDSSERVESIGTVERVVGVVFLIEFLARLICAEHSFTMLTDLFLWIDVCASPALSAPRPKQLCPMGRSHHEHADASTLPCPYAPPRVCNPRSPARHAPCRNPPNATPHFPIAHAISQAAPPPPVPTHPTPHPSRRPFPHPPPPHAMPQCLSCPSLLS